MTDNDAQWPTMTGHCLTLLTNYDTVINKALLQPPGYLISKQVYLEENRCILKLRYMPNAICVNEIRRR